MQRRLKTRMKLVFLCEKHQQERKVQRGRKPLLNHQQWNRVTYSGPLQHHYDNDFRIHKLVGLSTLVVVNSVVVRLRGWECKQDSMTVAGTYLFQKQELYVRESMLNFRKQGILWEILLVRVQHELLVHQSNVSARSLLLVLSLTTLPIIYNECIERGYTEAILFARVPM